MRRLCAAFLGVAALASVAGCSTPHITAGELGGLSRLTPGRVRAANGLWIENSPELQFRNSRRVVVADLAGPGVISMIHFAYAQRQVADPKYQLGRELLLKIYWEGEAEPSVDVPMVDFFCDPAGTREQVNTQLVNKRRGYNCYFPMPFERGAKIELVYEGSQEPGEQLWSMMPCYSYVVWRQLAALPADEGRFHAQWRQASVLIGKEPYLALEATGRGKFIGWNVVERRPGFDGPPVDMNEKFYIDGEGKPSVEFQGIEDSFGFSWGYPPTENIFPLTGYWPFMKGYFSYRWFISDAISFDESLRVTIDFGDNEDAMFRREFSKPGTQMQFSTTCYWYQAEPHAAFPPMLPAAERNPAPEQRFWPLSEKLPTEAELKARGVRLLMLCGRPEQEVMHAEEGFGAKVIEGYAWAGWPPPVYHARAGDKKLAIELAVPKGAAGLLRLYIADPDGFGGGREQTIWVQGREVDAYKGFQDGRWIEVPISADQVEQGRLSIAATNVKSGSNAVISIIEWVDQGRQQ